MVIIMKAAEEYAGLAWVLFMMKPSGARLHLVNLLLFAQYFTGMA